jgi:alkylation response protein AidB-like acyl-CoA dehydrogenase
MDFSVVAIDAHTEKLAREFEELLHEVVGDVQPWPIGGERFPEELRRRLGASGFLLSRWPEEDGGLGAGALLDRVIADELTRRQLIPGRMNAMVSLAVRKYGSEEIRDDVIRGVAAGELNLCLGYTEPDGGSDIAGAKTRAVRDGDEWVINGSKVFTSTAHFADYVFLLTNTNPSGPKHRNLTMFLVPLDLPGIEIQPLVTFGGDRTNITYYSDVRVPDKYRLGDVDAGWRVLNDPLTVEHGQGASDQEHLDDVHGQGPASTHPWAVLLGRTLRWASTRDENGVAPFDDPVVAAEIAQSAADYTVACNSPSAMGKVAAANGFIRSAERLLRTIGPAGLVMSQADRVEDGVFDWAHRRAQVPAITGGTVEVFKNMIATSALGLPRPLPAANR